MSHSVLGRKARAVVLLARGASTDHVGKEVGVTSRTVRRWLEEPEFAGQVQEIRQSTLEETVHALGVTARAAVGVLGQALKDESATIRVRAALGVLTCLPTIAAHVDLEQRVAALEGTEQ